MTQIKRIDPARRARRLALWLAIGLGGIGSVGSVGAAQAPEPAKASVDATTAPDYTLGTGDKVRISVFGEDRLTGEYVVTGGGNISFPLIGNVPAKGISLEKLQETIQTRLASGYVRDPKVSAEVLNYRPYYIFGEINKPGEYPYTIGLTVQQAVAMAGGFSYRANTERVFIKQAMETIEKPVRIKKTDPVSVNPGDTIRIGERFF